MYIVFNHTYQPVFPGPPNNEHEWLCLYVFLWNPVTGEVLTVTIHARQWYHHNPMLWNPVTGEVLGRRV